MSFLLKKLGTQAELVVGGGTWLTSLADSTTAGWSSPAIDNTTLRADDIEVYGYFQTGATPVVNQMVHLYSYKLVDYAAAIYTGGASGNAAALTPLNRAVMEFIKSIPVAATANSRYEFGFSMKNVHGYVPLKSGLWINNNSGFALHGTASNHKIFYTPVYYENVDALP